MWIRVTNHKAVNLDTGSYLDIEQEERLVYHDVLLFNKIRVNRIEEWELTGECVVVLKGKGTYHTIRKGNEMECIRFLDYLMGEEQIAVLDLRRG